MSAAYDGEAAPAARCIALYPGAFRPPHKAHLAAIRDLAARPDVDEVVVVVANRCRCIPGTTKALDAGIAQRVLSIYLRGMPKTRVEVAPHNAVSHALGYLEKAAAGDTLLFCVGEADFDSGDDRFEDLLSLHKRSDVAARVLPLPTGALKTRATALREALGAGDAGRDEFMTALPDELNPRQRLRVWSICRDGLRELDDIVDEKLRTLLEPLVGRGAELRCVVPGKLDPVFRVRGRDGKNLFVKYAGETAEAGSLGDPLRPKPRRRLSAERRALRCLRADLRSDVELADVVAFDKASSLLVLSEVCRGGERLQEQLLRGVFDRQVAAQAGGFLGACHSLAGPVPALWGEDETDLRHWRAMLALRTAGIESTLLSPQQLDDLRRLQAASEAARRKGFFVLDYCPKNVLVGSAGIGVIDLELCSSDGDPACDLGLFLGHYMLCGMCSGANRACRIALAAALDAYRHEIGGAWMDMAPRVAAFAGAAILHAIVRDRRAELRRFGARWLGAGGALLARGLDAGADAGTTLADWMSAAARQ